MKPIHIKRLRKLIAFLQKLPPKHFDFWEVRRDRECGTVGCAIGWAPNVFPRKICAIRRGNEFTIALKGTQINSWDVSFQEVAQWLTGLSGGFSQNLFMPGSQNLVHRKLPVLGGSATPKQVARMLEKFIKLQTESK